MTDLFWEPEGATPLTAEDRVGLRIPGIALRKELNLAEAVNIARAQAWATTRLRGLQRLLTRDAVRQLHRRMFGDVWSWAGELRVRDTNIGVSPWQITTDLENLLLDVQAQTADLDRLPWPAEEIAVRFHHRLVSIHPFTNGNGRHARLAANLLVTGLDGDRFTWGKAGELADVSAARDQYIAALRTADRGNDYGPLLLFAQS